MNSQRDEPVPRGYVRVWVVTAWNRDEGHVYADEAWARDQAADWNDESDEPHTPFAHAEVTPLDVPAGAVPGLGTVGKRKARKR